MTADMMFKPGYATGGTDEEWEAHLARKPVAPSLWSERNGRRQKDLEEHNPLPEWLAVAYFAPAMFVFALGAPVWIGIAEGFRTVACVAWITYKLDPEAWR